MSSAAFKPAASVVAAIAIALAASPASPASAASSAGFSQLTSVLAQSPAPDYGTTWVTNPAENELVEYGAAASGSADTKAIIKGSATGLSDPVGVTADQRGDIFAVSDDSSSITEYAPESTGNSTPIATIQGAVTGLNRPSSVTATSTQVWVTNPATNSIEAFTIGDTGNIAPATSIRGDNTSLNNPVQIAASEDNFGLWVLNRPATARASITWYDSQSGNTRPMGRIIGSDTGLTDPTSLAVDGTISGSPSVEVTNGATNSILRFDGMPVSPNEPPDDQISGRKTTLDDPVSVSINAAGDVVAANGGTGQLLVFDNGIGDHAPSRTVNSAVTQGADIFVTSAAPTPPLHFKAVAHRHYIHLSWQTPTRSGGARALYQLCGAPLYGNGDICDSEDLTFPYTISATHYNVPDVTDGVIYIFAIEAFNETGESGYVGFKDAEPRGTPQPPSDIAVAVTRHSVSVGWTPPANNGGARITRYTVSYAECAARNTCQPGRTLTTRRPRLRIARLGSHTTYRIRIRARNRYGRGPGAATTARTR
jgi:hypothetical protein